MLLEVLICTIDDRIVRAVEAILPQIDMVSYLLCWQRTTDQTIPLPSLIEERTDIRIVEHRSRGLSHNRNVALDHAQGDILLLADDDISYTPDAFHLIRTYFQEHPECDVLATQIKRSNGLWHKCYPKVACAIEQVTRGYYVSSVELSLRRSTSLPYFDERFGLGSNALASGEEEVFVQDCIRRKLQVEFAPIHTATLRNTSTTGQYFDSQVKVRRSKGAVLMYCYGCLGAYLRSVKYAFCYRGILSRWQVWRDLLWGIHYIAKGR